MTLPPTQLMMVFEVLSRAYSAFDGLSPLFPPVFTPVRTAGGRRACKKDGRNGGENEELLQ